LHTLLGEARLLLTHTFSFDTLLRLPNLRLHGSNARMLWGWGFGDFVYVHTDIYGCRD
jgi:hypothetical protein